MENPPHRMQVIDIAVEESIAVETSRRGPALNVMEGIADIDSKTIIVGQNASVYLLEPFSISSLQTTFPNVLSSTG
jgi:hypothetical protein